MKTKFSLGFFLLFLTFGLSSFGQDSLSKPNNATTDSIKSATMKEIYSRLNPDQIFELEMAKINGPRVMMPPPPPLPADRLTTICFLIAVVLIAFILSYFKHKKTIKLYDIYLTSLEKNREVPFELLHQPKEIIDKLNKAIGLVCIGIGYIVAIKHFDGIIGEFAGIGAIPIFLGIGYLVSHLIDRKKNK